MKEFWKTIRLAFYVVALPIAATATLAADRLFQDEGSNQEEIIPAKASTSTFVAKSQRSHAFVRDSKGVLQGRVTRFDSESGMSIGNANAHVVFMRDNKTIESIVTDENGMFSTDKLQPGPYSVVATSKDGFATFGAYVVNSDLPVSPVMELATVAAGSSKVHEILSKPRGSAATISEPMSHFDMKQDDLKMDDQGYKMPENIVNGANRVKLTKDGSFKVRVYPLVGKTEFKDTTAYLLQNDQVIGQLPVTSDGRSEFKSVDPGHYDLVIKSEFGILALGMEVVSNVESIAMKTDSQPMAAYQDEPSDEAGVVLAEEGQQNQQQPQTIIREYYFTETVGAGGFGGGPVGGGFGGLNGLIETALAAWVLSELIDEIDRNNNNEPVVVQQPIIIEPPPPASPAR